MDIILILFIPVLICLCIGNNGDWIRCWICQWTSHWRLSLFGNYYDYYDHACMMYILMFITLSGWRIQATFLCHWWTVHIVHNPNISPVEVN